MTRTPTRAVRTVYSPPVRRYLLLTDPAVAAHRGDRVLVGEAGRHARRTACVPVGVTTTTCTPGGASTGASTLAVVVAQQPRSAAWSAAPLVDHEEQAPRRPRARRRRAGRSAGPSRTRRTTQVGHVAAAHRSHPVAERPGPSRRRRGRACGAGSARRCPRRPRPRRPRRRASTSSRTAEDAARAGGRAPQQHRTRARTASTSAPSSSRDRPASPTSSAPPRHVQHGGVVEVPAQQGPQPGQQLVDVERLAEVVLGAGVEPLDPVARVCRSADSTSVGCHAPAAAQPGRAGRAPRSPAGPGRASIRSYVAGQPEVQAALAVAGGVDGVPLARSAAR